MTESYSAHLDLHRTTFPVSEDTAGDPMALGHEQDVTVTVEPSGEVSERAMGNASPRARTARP